MTLVVICGALGLALGLAAGAAAALRHARKSLEDRVAAAVDRARAELSGSVAAQERFTGELAASLDLAEVAERTIQSAGAVPGVEAVLLEFAGTDGERASAAAGVADDELAKVMLHVPESENLRAVEFGIRYRLDDVNAGSNVVRSGLAVPVRAEGLPVGTLTAFTRSADGKLGDEQLEELERLVFRAGPALENARRFTEARTLADLDALTGLHNRRYFHETLAREVARAHRYRRQLSLVLLDLDDFKAINDRIGHLAGDSVLAEVAARTMAVVRSADIACRVGGDEFGVILPESGRQDGELLSARVAREIGVRPIGKAGLLYVSAGVADLREGDDAVKIFERADEALYRAKELGKARTVSANDAS